MKKSEFDKLQSALTRMYELNQIFQGEAVPLCIAEVEKALLGVTIDKGICQRCQGKGDVPDCSKYTESRLTMVCPRCKGKGTE